MTVSEFLFLALGLVLGVASGIALIELLRARPPVRREVRVTVSKDAIPRRRAPTLAEDAFVNAGAEPARGGPADRRALTQSVPAGMADRRTNVRDDPLRAALAAPAGKLRPALVGMPVASGSDPMLGAIRGDRPLAAVATSVPAGERSMRSGHVEARTDPTPSTTVALMDPPTAGPEAPPAPVREYTGPCADERRLADERCEVATRAQAQATGAADALRRAQRSYDAHLATADASAAAAHPHAVRSRKEEAQRAFRTASRGAGSPGALEEAARTWLHDINRINREAAAASLTEDRERAAAAAVGATIERLGREADAARVGAEIAQAACVEARGAVAACDEQTAGGAPVAKPASKPSAAAAAHAPVGDTSVDDLPVDDELGLALEGGGRPRIFRLLRGDAAAMDALVASLGAGDADDQRRWKLSLATLLDAILADAIHHGFLRYPHQHPFWGPYTLEQNRDVTRALSSLGYRFDGLGGWVDDRIPSQRELSLALGYAGLDPMRIRHWPTDAETRALFTNVEVAADEYLAGAAGGLSLAEMVELLGRRADSLVDLWNHWGRVRPLLLEEV